MALSTDDEQLLKRLYGNVAQVELTPDDPRYVPFEAHTESFGPDVVKELARSIAWTGEDSSFFFSGLRGSGKSTQLLRLRRELAGQGFAAVRLDAEDYLNLRQPVDIVEFLFFLVGGVADAVEDAGWLPEHSAAKRTWDRLKLWLTGLPDRIETTPEATVGVGGDLGPFNASVDLKAELRRDERFVAQLRRFLDGRLSELVAEANSVVDDLVADLRAAWPDDRGEWQGLVVLVDSLDHVRGADFKAVRRALVDLVDKRSSLIKLRSARTVYIVPPWVHVDYTAVRKLANVKLATTHEETFAPGYDTMREILERRMPDGSDLSTFFPPGAVDRLIADSGGHLRDLLRLVRGASVAADGLPFDAAALDRGRSEVRDGLLPIADDEAACLRIVRETRDVPLPTQDDWETLASLFDRHLVLGYKNGETWYGVHPLIRSEIDRPEPPADPAG